MLTLYDTVKKTGIYFLLGLGAWMEKDFFVVFFFCVDTARSAFNSQWQKKRKSLQKCHVNSYSQASYVT